MPADNSTVLIDHITVLGRDLERSNRFYCDALGFQKAAEHVFGNEAAVTNCVTGECCNLGHFLMVAGTTFVLNKIVIPADRVTAPRQQFGLTNSRCVYQIGHMRPGACATIHSRVTPSEKGWSRR